MLSRAEPTTLLSTAGLWKTHHERLLVQKAVRPVFLGVYAEQAEERAGLAGVSMNCLAQDVETASFPSNTFDRILCSNGMTYLQHPQAMLQKFHLWLRPGGKLAFNNPLVRPVPSAEHTFAFALHTVGQGRQLGC